jgi:hypothetical protein
LQIEGSLDIKIISSDQLKLKFGLLKPSFMFQLSFPLVAQNENVSNQMFEDECIECIQKYLFCQHWCDMA